jgi:hypothetical protein
MSILKTKPVYSTIPFFCSLVSINKVDVATYYSGLASVSVEKNGFFKIASASGLLSRS